MWFEQVLFFVAAIGALAGALGVVLLQNPFYSVLSLVGHLLGLAVLFLLLNAEFLAAAQVVVYAGAVMVLYLFVVAYIGGADEPLRPESGALGTLRAAVRRARSPWSCASRSSAAGSRRSTRAGADVGRRRSARPARSASCCCTDFLLPFEAASFLLLIAAVGAVVLARAARPRRLGRHAQPAASPTETLEVRV